MTRFDGNGEPGGNIDSAVVDGFGDEWTRMDQGVLTGREYDEAFESYFHIFPWRLLARNAVGFDLGCGSGRWARGVAPRVGALHCIDASPAALEVARRNLKGVQGVRFHLASVDSIPLLDASMDFGYCLGVLHHVPDTRLGLRCAVSKLRQGAPLLVYLYYAFDNQPTWFRLLHEVSNGGRLLISRAPHGIRYAASQAIAALVYWPLARLARIAERFSADVHSFPLSYYRKRRFYSMRTDALDRFGTRLEKRFTQTEVREMMEEAGLTDIVFSDRAPFWCAVGIRQ
jgi:SAM-dependent methyltransferase